MPSRVLHGLVFGAALASAGPALGMEPKWPQGPYKYLVIDQDVKGVLVEFGRNVGSPVVVSDQVKGRLRGQVAVATASAGEFLDNLCDSYGLVWYFDGTVLHVNAKSEVRTELVGIGQLSAAEASKKLGALGVADARFAVRGTENANVISVSGPPKFVSLVRQAFAMEAPKSLPVREDSNGDEVTVRVFRGGSMAAPPEASVTSRAKSGG
jgi:type II secretory pathway component GspD/PulD (secretin)